MEPGSGAPTTVHRIGVQAPLPTCRRGASRAGEQLSPFLSNTMAARGSGRAVAVPAAGRPRERQTDPVLCLLGRHQRHPDGSLLISRVAAEDRGFYACVAFNGQDRDQRWVQLRVLGKAACGRGTRDVRGGLRAGCVLADAPVPWAQRG